jgi:uncharacterized membrane protein YheB (UPF0754 family)
MKSTNNFFENLSNNEFRKAKVDLQKAQEHILRKRVAEKKKEVVQKYNDK